LIDLGRTMPGTVEFDAELPAGTKLTVEIGEAMMPTRSYPVTPAPDGKRHVFRPLIKHDGWTGLRFVWLHFDNPQGRVTFHWVRGVYQVLQCKYEGDFACSDEMLTRIWEMCVYSAHAVMGQGDSARPAPCLQTLCLDRLDRYPWAGDSRMIQTAVLDAFGQYDLVRSNLDRMLPKAARPIPDLQCIPPYTLDWALAVMDYYRYSGDVAFLAERLGDVTAIIDRYDAWPARWQDRKTPTPREQLQSWMFFDWDPRIGKGVDAQTTAAFAGKYVQTCRQLAEAAGRLNRSAAADHAAQLARKHVAQWREQHRKDWEKTYDTHAITNLILGDVLLSPEERSAAFAKAFADRQKRWTGTPYFGSYVLDALARLDRRQEAVEMLHDYWGTMIDAGATTVWEEWNPMTPLPVNCQPPQEGPPFTWGALSLIQPAGVGPARWLDREVLGISPALPGFARVRIEPHVVGLSWAKGAVASPRGPVSVSWADQASEFRLEFSTPAGCQGVEVVVPLGKAYRLDDRTIEPQSSGHGSATFTVGAKKHVFIVAK
jgi:hypothetical protein